MYGILKKIFRFLARLFGGTSLTIESLTNSVTYTGAGSTATYGYTFKIFDDDEVIVKVKLTSTLAETTLTKGVDYSVTGVGVSAGGNVVLIDADQAWLDGSGFLLSTYTITLTRVPSFLQETSITSQSQNNPEYVEKQFDRSAMQAQYLKRKVDQSLKLPDTETGTAASTTLPNVDDRINTYMVFDEDGNPAVTTITATADAAPKTSSFVVIATDSTLTNERVLTGTVGQISITDNGAGNTVVAALMSPLLVGDVSATGDLAGANCYVSTLTSGRVVVAGASGRLVDDSGLAYNTTTDALTVAGNVSVTGTASQPNVLNESGVDQDTRIESDTRTHMVFVDASTDRVGINTSGPAANFHVTHQTESTEIMRVNSGSTNTSFKWYTAADVSTTDATVTTIFSITPPVSGIMTVTATVNARVPASDGVTGSGFIRVATFYTSSAAAVTQMGSTTSVHTAEADAATDCTIDTSGGLVRVRVTGKAATTYNWQGHVEICGL